MCRCPCKPYCITSSLLLLNADKGVVQELRSLRVSVDDFVLKGVVGRGHFGEVRVVSERSSGQVLAMKVMKKEDILKQSDVRRRRGGGGGTDLCRIVRCICSYMYVRKLDELVVTILMEGEEG